MSRAARRDHGGCARVHRGRRDDRAQPQRRADVCRRRPSRRRARTSGVGPILARTPTCCRTRRWRAAARGIAIEDAVGAPDRAGAAPGGAYGLVDPGSVSLGGSTRDGLPVPTDLVYVNSFADARYMVDRCAELGLAPSISIFDPSFLRVALAFHAARRAAAGLDREALLRRRDSVRPSADAGWPRRLSRNAGRDRSAVVGRGVGRRRDRVRPGARGHRARRPCAGRSRGPFGARHPNERRAVAAAARLVEACGRSVATPAETHALLGLDTGDGVAPPQQQP